MKERKKKKKKELALYLPALTVTPWRGADGLAWAAPQIVGQGGAFELCPSAQALGNVVWKAMTKATVNNAY